MGILSGALLVGFLSKYFGFWKKDITHLEKFDELVGKLGDPVLIQAKLQKLSKQAIQLSNKSIYLQILSQIALMQAVQKKFAEAHLTLDQAEKLLTSQYDLAKVRILCERGRVFQQAGDLAQARIYFEKSYELSMACKFDKQTINAAHMIAIVAPTSAEKIAWNNKALDLAMHTYDASAQSWRGPILNNLGANYLENQQLEKALDVFENALIEFKKTPEATSSIRFVKFKVAQVLRMLVRLDEALEMLHLQLQEYDTMNVAGNFDIQKDMFVVMRGCLYEEIAIIYEVKNNFDEAKKYAHLALLDLDNNQLFMTIEHEYQARIEKLNRL
jgi:tetratricopeptide (TPR) repeat protein